MPEAILDPIQTDTLPGFLPTFTPSNEVPNPNWPSLPAGQFGGIIVLTGPNGLGEIPPYMRIYQGIVEVFFAWPDTRADVYYHDDRGLGIHLSQVLLNPPSGACCEGGCEQRSACTCTDLAAGTYLGPASSCESACCAPGAVGGLQVFPFAMAWMPDSGGPSITYDIARGRTAGPTFTGDFSGFTEPNGVGCLPGCAVSSISYPIGCMGDPQPGQCDMWVVRARGCSVGSWDEGGFQVGTRDGGSTGIPGTVCP
jgi:hypothetical protein